MYEKIILKNLYLHAWTCNSWNDLKTIKNHTVSLTVFVSLLSLTQIPSHTQPHSQTCTHTELASVTCDELQQHKNYLKVTKKQEKELKELEKKFQKKGEELTQKYSDLFKALKKKTSPKKNE